MKKTIKVTGIECPKCKEFIWSRHRHDFRHCKCGYCYVDGGREYLRFGFGGEDFPEPHTPPEPEVREVEITVSKKKPITITELFNNDDKWEK